MAGAFSWSFSACENTSGGAVLFVHCPHPTMKQRLKVLLKGKGSAGDLHLPQGLAQAAGLLLSNHHPSQALCGLRQARCRRTGNGALGTHLPQPRARAVTAAASSACWEPPGHAAKPSLAGSGFSTGPRRGSTRSPAASRPARPELENPGRGGR